MDVTQFAELMQLLQQIHTVLRDIAGILCGISGGLLAAYILR